MSILQKVRSHPAVKALQANGLLLPVVVLSGLLFAGGTFAAVSVVDDGSGVETLSEIDDEFSEKIVSLDVAEEDKGCDNQEGCEQESDTENNAEQESESLDQVNEDQNVAQREEQVDDDQSETADEEDREEQNEDGFSFVNKSISESSGNITVVFTASQNLSGECQINFAQGAKGGVETVQASGKTCTVTKPTSHLGVGDWTITADYYGPETNEEFVRSDSLAFTVPDVPSNILTSANANYDGGFADLVYGSASADVILDGTCSFYYFYNNQLLFQSGPVATEGKTCKHTSHLDDFEFSGTWQMWVEYSGFDGETTGSIGPISFGIPTT